MAHTIGSKIVLEGEKEYRQALQNINAEQKNLRSELKLCASEFEGQQNSLEALTKKHEILERQIESQNKKVELYTQRLEETRKAHEKAGEKIGTLSGQLEEATKEMEAMKASSDTSAEALQEQQKHIDELKKKLTNASEEYRKTEVSAKQWQTQINNATADLNSMNSDLRNTEKYMEEARGSVDNCATSIDEYGKAVKSSTNDTQVFGDVLKANIGSEIIVKGFEKIISLAKEAGEELLNCAMGAFAYADNIATMSTNTGVAIETLQEITYAQELMDVSLETVTSSMAKNIRSMKSAQEGSKSYVEAYERLGVSVVDVDGKLRDSEEVYWNLIDALGKVENQTERDSLAMTIFGKSAQDLNSLIAIGSQGFANLAKEARDAGFVLSEDAISTLLDTSDAFERMNNRVTSVKNNIGSELAPTLTMSFEKIGDAAEEVQDEIVDLAEDAIPILINGLEWIVDNGDIVISLMTGMTAAAVYHGTVAPAVMAVTEAWAAYKAANEGATIAQYAMNAAMNANPAGILVTAIVGLTSALAVYAMTTEKAESDTDRLIKRSREAADALKADTQARRESAAASETEIATTRRLAQELTELDKKESLSTAEKSRMLMVVSELNQALPDLNLTIDKQTGHLSENAKGWEKSASAMLESLELQYKQEDLNAIARERYEAEKQLTEIMSEREELERKLADASAAYNEASQGIVYGTESQAEAMYNASQKMQELTDAIEAQKEVEEEFQAQVTELGEEFTSLHEELSAVDEKLEESGEYQVEYGGKLYQVKEATEETKEAVNALAAEYEEARLEAEESINAQVGLFEKLVVQSDLSSEQMRENLQSQTDAFTQYKDDLLIAAGLVEQGILDEGLLGAIQELGMDGAGYLHELATSSEEDLGSVVESFRQMEEARDNLANVIADMAVGYSDRMDEILGIQTDKQEMYKTSAEECGIEANQIVSAAGQEMVGTAAGTMADFNTEIVTGTPVIIQSTDELCSNMITTANTKLNIVEGKSLVFQEIGRSIPDGLSEGIRSGTSEVELAITDLVDRMIDKAVRKIEDAAKEIDRALGNALR